MSTDSDWALYGGEPFSFRGRSIIPISEGKKRVGSEGTSGEWPVSRLGIQSKLMCKPCYKGSGEMRYGTELRGPLGTKGKIII